MRKTLSPVPVGEVIKEGDLCREITGGLIPAKASIGRKVRPENLGYVLRYV